MSEKNEVITNIKDIGFVEVANIIMKKRELKKVL